tara:strand:- start:17914 stop:18162 length:249 start_codon:yes stop_codon:yes gene_type:complete
MDNKNRLKGWGEHPKPQKQKLPKQYREKKLIKPVVDPYGISSIDHLQFQVRTDVEKDKKVKPIKVFKDYNPPAPTAKKVKSK